MRFSQRMGLTPVRVAVQGRSLDQATRAQLWSALAAAIPAFRSDGRYDFANTWMYQVYQHIWAEFFKEPADEMGGQEAARMRLKTLILEGEWYECFDLIEFLRNSGHITNLGEFPQAVDRTLASEMAAFRWMNGQFVEITDETEIAAIETALAVSEGSELYPVRRHLEKALALLSDRKSPDYRNSIKESISAVEAVVQVLTDDPKAELGKGLKLLEAKKPLHGALRSALLSLYGYTSDADGIRHALTEAENLDAADAKFMLVACSAFVVYLVQRVGL